MAALYGTSQRVVPVYAVTVWNILLSKHNEIKKHPVELQLYMQTMLAHAMFYSHVHSSLIQSACWVCAD